VDRNDVLAACRARPSATEGYPFGEGVLVFTVGGKMFAIVGDASVSLKCEPGHAQILRENYPAITPGYHLDKRHWNTVDLNGAVPDDVLQDLIEDSYELVASKLPRAKRAELTL
jgi:predicted DNA-binding protein (MmcQ/YjbR family)